VPEIGIINFTVNLYQRIIMNAIRLCLITFLALIFVTDNVFSLEAPRETQWKPLEGLELIGTKAPGLSGLKWLNSEPLQIEDLKGNVVLIRFWLVGCPFCVNTAPSLVELHEKYGDKGLRVIGIHHPKSERTRDENLVKMAAKQFGYDFPIAQDQEWKVINQYWLGDKKRSYTSSTFLIDKNGVIRLVHDGGEFYKSSDNKDADGAYYAIDKKIKELLAE